MGNSGMPDLNQLELKTFATVCLQKMIQARTDNEYFDLPYRHIVIDNSLDRTLAENCVASFPSLDSDCCQTANNPGIEVTFRTTWMSEFDIPDGIIDAVQILDSSIFLNAMARRIGIQKIMPDPYFTGGGLNVTRRGGLLDVHVDGNYHDASGLNRRLNEIVDLTPRWEEGWGGEFGIYDETGKNCVKRVAPIVNRLAIFDSHGFSSHGLPEPINFAEEVNCMSIIVYYCTKEARPARHTAVSPPHSALWVERNLKDKRGAVTREYS